MLPISWSIYPIDMRRESPGPRRSLICTAFLLFILLTAALAQAPVQPAGPLTPLPPDTGTAGLTEMLRRLHTTARLMQTTAHPDDEDGGMLTLESRGKGVDVTLMTLNRGEGGQNKVGSNLFDVLGVVRTLELTAADRYYGVHQRFSRVADFGFSKNADETFQKWHGHDIALADMVRVIRTFRPDVLVARFSGTERDGHGHHQASAILTMEAFRVAADPHRFPEQFADGLAPWQPKKLYIGNVCGFGASSCPDENYTVKLNTGQDDPILGMSYAQFAMEGLRHQLSQGAGGWSLPAGPHYTFYKLLASTVPASTGHEESFFDGIDSSLPALASRLGQTEGMVPFLHPALTAIAGLIDEATANAAKDPASAAAPLSEVAKKLYALMNQLQRSEIPDAARAEVLSRLQEKEDQARAAQNLALGVTLQATVAAEAAASTSNAALPKEQQALTVVSPGQKFTVGVKLHNGSTSPLELDEVELEASRAWGELSQTPKSTVQPGQDSITTFAVTVPKETRFTRPYWHRANPETDSVNIVDDDRFTTLPFPPPVLQAMAKYRMKQDGQSRTSPSPSTGKKSAGAGGDSTPPGQIENPVIVHFLGENGAPDERILATAPAFSVMLEPGEQVIPVEGQSASEVKVGVSYNLSAPAMGSLHLELPHGWRAEPASLPVEFQHRGDKHDFNFKVFPGKVREGREEIRAVLESAGQKYSEGYSLVTREDLRAFYYYQPALQRVSMVDVKVPSGLKVGYIMGAGDDIPTVLKQIGMDVTLIPAEMLATTDLSSYGTVVLGIRAYDTQKEVAANNKKLLDWVSAGGTLVVQYDAGVSDFNSGHFTPYPAQLSRERVSVEEAAVEILAPEDGVFHHPNKITKQDFDGWVQERGLYFMDSWDSHFKPLLACHDPGEPEQKGGLLQAQYGKGTYIYTGYAFFRQLPAGVPGAVRLYVNLLAAGHEK